MTVQILPSILKGSVTAIPSKSELHRALICASFCDKPTDIIVPGSAYSEAENIPDDIRATVSCLKELGADIVFTSNLFHVIPVSSTADYPILNCQESGSTLRFLLPVAAACSRNAHFTGSGRLPERPVQELLSVLVSHGISISSQTLPLFLSGSLTGGSFTVPGNISSQYLTGMLLTLPLLPSGSDILLSTELRSKAYIDITIEVMSKFGINIICKDNRYYVSGSSSYKSPGTVTIGGDWSNAAAFLIAGSINKKNAVIVSNLNCGSSQGDKSVINILHSFGASCENNDWGLSCSADNLSGIELDIDSTPDLMPVLAVAAMAASGKTVFINAARLRAKESDRISSVEKMAKALSVEAESFSDSLIIYGSSSVKGGIVDSCNDHRIVMAAAIASCITNNPVTITNAEAINKSYPTFFEDFRSLGGTVYVI